MVTFIQFSFFCIGILVEACSKIRVKRDATQRGPVINKSHKEAMKFEFFFTRN